MGNKESTDDTVLQGRWAHTVDLRNCQVRLRKCRVKDIRMVTAFIGIIASELKLTTAGEIGVAVSDANVILQLISTCSEQVNVVIASLIDKDKDFFEDLDLDEGLAVALALYELNKTFFVEQVYPKMSPLLELLKPKSVEKPSNEKTQKQAPVLVD